MSKQSITLKIAGKQYPLSVDSRQEELYRLAEREINERFSRIEKAKFKDFNLILRSDIFHKLRNQFCPHSIFCQIKHFK